MEIDQGAARAQASAGCPIPSCCWRCPDATRSGLGGVWRPPDGDPTVPTNRREERLVSTWVYLESEPGCWTVGYYDPSDRWQPVSDHASPEEAAEKVHYLNGGCPGNGGC